MGEPDGWMHERADSKQSVNALHRFPSLELMVLAVVKIMLGSGSLELAHIQRGSTSWHNFSSPMML